MRRRPARAMILITIGFLIIFSGLISVAQMPLEKPAHAATRFEKDIVAFEKTDQMIDPPNSPIVFTGSSSIRMWHKDLQSDFPGLPVMGRGFGGSTMADLLYYQDRLVFKYLPRAVVIYEGDNDVNAGIATETILKQYQAFFQKYHQKQPKSRVYVLSIKPSPARWSKWEKIQEANQALREWCESHEKLTYVDIAKPMLDDSGKPIASLFTQDHLHMNRNGYQIWRDVIRPILLENEAGPF